MPLRKEPPTPRSAAVNARLDPNSHHAGSSSTALAPLIPFKPGQTSLRRQAILTEDEYTSALSTIIKRDFFPGLDRITAENEYLAAVEAEEPIRIRAALNRLLRLDRGTDASPVPQRAGIRKQNDGPRATTTATSERGEWDDTPIASGPSSRVFDPTFTPVPSTPGLYDPGEAEQEGDAELASGITPDLDLSLAGFQSRYTSEDNASFSQLLDRDNQLRKRKHAHLYAREQASEQRRKHIIDSEQRAAETGKQWAIEANPDHPKLLEEAKPTLMIEGRKGKSADRATDKEQPSNEESSRKDPMDDLVLVSEPRQDDRPTPTGLNRWKYTARNALMFPPDANVSYLHALPSTAATTSRSDDIAQPETNFSALRLPEQSDTLTASPNPDARQESEAGWSPSSSRVDAAIQRGRAGSFTSSIAAASGADETPKVNGYGFVTPYSTPQHAAHAIEDDMHVRIYNAIKSKRGTASSSTAPDAAGFQLPKLDKREQLAQKLTSTPKSRATVAGAGASTPYGQARYGGLAGLRSRGFASPRQKAAELTPAARALLDRSTRGITPVTAGRRGFVSPAAVPQASPVAQPKRLGDRGWTPTPQHTRRAPP